MKTAKQQMVDAVKIIAAVYGFICIYLYMQAGYSEQLRPLTFQASDNTPLVTVTDSASITDAMARGQTLSINPFTILAASFVLALAVTAVEYYRRKRTLHTTTVQT